MTVVYPDRPGGRIHRALRRRRPPAVQLDEATARFIRGVAARYPKFTPDEVYVELFYGLRRVDVTKPMVRYALWLA